MILRGYCDHIYITCARTNYKHPIEDSSWDNGLLVANPFVDKAINGSFEFRVAIEASKDRQELQPAPKLYNPVDPSQQLYGLPASSGGL